MSQRFLSKMRLSVHSETIRILRDSASADELYRVIDVMKDLVQRYGQ